MAAQGLAHLHSKNVIHRDIKSDNILCKMTGEIKITDLGCSVLLHKGKAFRDTKVGSVNWFAPEIISGVAYSKEVDIWSFGAFAHELAWGEPPFRHVPDGQSVYDAILTMDVPRIPEKWSDTFDDFVHQCMTRDRLERPTIEQVLQHEFFQGMDVEACKRQWIED